MKMELWECEFCDIKFKAKQPLSSLEPLCPSCGRRNDVIPVDKPKFANVSNSTVKKKPKGWRYESARHSLARKGIKSGRKKKIKGTWVLKKQTPVQLVFEDIKGNLIGVDKSYGVKGYHVSTPAKEGHGEPKLISEKKGIKKIWLPEAGAYQYERFKSKKDALKFANKLMEKKM